MTSKTTCQSKEMFVSLVKDYKKINSKSAYDLQWKLQPFNKHVVELKPRLKLHLNSVQNSYLCE